MNRLRLHPPKLARGIELLPRVIQAMDWGFLDARLFIRLLNEARTFVA